MFFDDEKKDAEIPELDEEIIEDDEIYEDEEEPEEDETVSVPEAIVSVRVKDLNQLAEFANRRGNGNMQFMSKSNHEVFELRDIHFRIAEVWGTVTVARECSPEEYARVMLAIDLRDHREDYYMLPGLTEAEVREAINDFCCQRFSEKHGKKFSRKPEKFTKFLKDNECVDEWSEYTKALVYDKLEAFCENNGIVLGDQEDPETESEGNDGADS